MKDATSPGIGSMHRISKIEPSVYIIVLNYNNLYDTIESLRSVEKLNYENYKVLLVDNGSTEGIIGEIRKKFPNLEIIKNEKNLGYAGGNNVGILKAMGEKANYIFLLNNDVVVERDVLRKLVDAMEKEEHFAACQPLVSYFHEREKIWSAGTEFFIGYPRLYKKNKRAKLSGNFEPPFGLAGCALLMRISAVKDVGLFDESLFLMHEETEWCMRAKKKGYKLLVVTDAIVYHKVAVTLGLFGKTYLYYVSRNWLLVASKNFRWLMYLYVVLTELTVRLPYYMYHLFIRGQLGTIKYYLKGIKDGLLGVTGEGVL